MYAQIINNCINLIGGENIGLPLSSEFLAKNTYVQCIDITDINPKPQVGDYYLDGQFYTPDEYAAMTPPEPLSAEPYQPTNAEIAQQLSDLQVDLEISGVL